MKHKLLFFFQMPVKIQNLLTCKKINQIRRQDFSPAMLGSRSASSAEAAAHETLGKRYTPAVSESSRLLTSGKEKRLTTFIASPTI